MKRSSKIQRRYIVICTVLAVVALLYYTGTPEHLIVDLVKLCLLIAAIGYALIYPIVDFFKEIRSFREFKRIAKLKQSSDEIDTMTWQDFEIFVAKWLKHEGFSDIEITEYFDLGVDIIAKKDDITWGVQVKHYTNIVKVEAVRQVVVALKHYKCDRAMVVTNSFFSRPAKEIAASNGCELIEGKQLRKSPVTL